MIGTDSDSAFKGDNRSEDQNFQKILSDNNAVLEPVILNNHHALGIIDNFAKNLKRVLSKEFLENKSTEWVSILPKIIEQYNNTPHTSLDNITPEQADSKRSGLPRLRETRVAQWVGGEALSDDTCLSQLGR